MQQSALLCLCLYDGRLVFVAMCCGAKQPRIQCSVKFVLYYTSSSQLRQLIVGPTTSDYIIGLSLSSF